MMENCNRRIRRSAWRGNYFLTGAGADAGAGIEGAAGFDVVVEEEFIPCNTELVPDLRCARMESEIEVTTKMIADHVVARDNAVAAPRGPKAV
jgi:hypothetical protein